MGAIFLDGGWSALYKVFGRIILPQIFFMCKYSDKICVDLIQEIQKYFERRGKPQPRDYFINSFLGQKVIFQYKNGAYTIQVGNDAKFVEVRGTNEQICKRKAAEEAFEKIRKLEESLK